MENQSRLVAEKKYGILALPVSVDLIDASLLNEAVHKAEAYEVVMLNDMLPDTPSECYNALKRIKEHGYKTPSCLYSQTHTGSLCNLHFLWKTNDPVDPESQARVIEQIQNQLPQFHTRAMKREFVNAASKLSVSPMHARYLYSIVADDAGAATSKAVKVIDQRVMQFVELEDETIIMDLRAVHDRHSKFDAFFEAAKAVINDDSLVETAVDERRHNLVTHLATAISAADLYR